MSNPMVYTLGEAAKACGKSKTTISKALKSGRLSFIEKTSAGYCIDPAELHRVFPPVTGEPLGVDDRKPPAPIPDNAAQIATLESQVTMLREMLERAERNADEWRDQAQRLALTHDNDERGRGGLFGWLKRRG